MSQTESSRKHYLKNRAARIADKKARKRRNHIFVQEYKKSHPCVNCGESEPCCLDFHHKNPAEKFRVIGGMADRGFGLDKIKAEIAKCEILCANCHRRFHYGLLAQSGERRTCNAEAGGAEPPRSTNIPVA
jgi:hypothetical protein